jgi:long-chain acyl-CoA synthetase
MQTEDYRYWSSHITHIIHSAANVSFRQTLEQARHSNLYGTENVMSLARSGLAAGKLERVAYISTAYISGNRSGKIYEEELDCGQNFSNTYEQSKFESELRVRRLMSELPITIFRPSIIVGDSETGKTRAFNVLYFPLKLLYRGVLKVLPGSPQTPTDIVPVDYVCDAFYHIFFRSNSCLGKTFHLTAGAEKATTAGEVVNLAVNYFNQVAGKKKYRTVRFIPAQFYHAARHLVYGQAKKIFQVMENFESYLLVKKSFDDGNTRTAMNGTGIRVQSFRKYYQLLLDYCLACDWGDLIKAAPVSS